MYPNPAQNKISKIDLTNWHLHNRFLQPLKIKENEVDLITKILLKGMDMPSEFNVLPTYPAGHLGELEEAEIKENNMNKQEAKEQVKKLQEELEKLQGIIEAPEGRWRAEEGDEYVFIADDGDPIYTRDESDEDEYDFHYFRHKASNYFQTIEQAKASNIYKILNDPYEYYIAGVSDNWDDVPKDGSAEVWLPTYGGSWHNETGAVSLSYSYRWEK